MSDDNTIKIADQWGPFTPDISPVEHVARCRALRVVAHLLCGPRADRLCETLRAAETEPRELAVALGLLNAMPSRDLRNVLSTYGWATCPHWSS